jgi:hypothetical protein
MSSDKERVTARTCSRRSHFRCCRDGRPREDRRYLYLPTGIRGEANIASLTPRTPRVLLQASGHFRLSHRWSLGCARGIAPVVFGKVSPVSSWWRYMPARLACRPVPLSCRTRFRGARLRRKSDANDTGANTQGTCIAFKAPSDFLAAETVLFPDGSTLDFQGIERGNALAVRTIVGGSGRYLGAIGTMTAAPSADLSRRTKTIELAVPLGQE